MKKTLLLLLLLLLLPVFLIVFLGCEDVGSTENSIKMDNMAEKQNSHGQVQEEAQAQTDQNQDQDQKEAQAQQAQEEVQVQEEDQEEDQVQEDQVQEKAQIQDETDGEAENPLSKEEIMGMFKEAHKVTLDILSQGFHAEYKGKEKVPFSEFQSQLQEYWSLEVINNLEYFYYKHLWDWGFEMPRAFPLASIENHQLVEINYEDERIEVTFLIDEGYDKDGFGKGVFEEKHVLVKEKGRWVIGL